MIFVVAQLGPNVDLSLADELSIGSSAKASSQKERENSPDAPIKIGKKQYEWSRESVIEFGFEQLVKLIDYVFVFATATLGLIVKSTVFDQINTAAVRGRRALTKGERRLLIAAIGLLTLSIVCGLGAYGTLPLLMMDSSFSLNGQVGQFAFVQFITAFLGTLSVGMFAVLRLRG